MKFRSQTSDHMDRWKSRGGKSSRRKEKRREEKRRGEERRGEKKRREEKRREEKKRRREEEKKRRREEEKKRRREEEKKKRRREEEGRSEKRKSQKKESEERVRRKKMQVLLKVAIHCVFPMICGSGGSKSRLATAAGAEPSGQMRDEKLHAVVAQSTFRSQNVPNTPFSDHFWKLRCRKSARRCGAKHISKSKCTKHGSFEPLLEVEMSKKCTSLWHEENFRGKMLKTPHVRTTFGRSDVVSRGRRKGLCTLSKASKRWPFSSISKNDGRRGTFEEDLERCISHGRRNTKDMFIRDVRRSGPLMHKSYGLSKGSWIFLQKCWLTSKQWFLVWFFSWNSQQSKCTEKLVVFMYDHGWNTQFRKLFCAWMYSITCVGAFWYVKWKDAFYQSHGMYKQFVWRVRHRFLQCQVLLLAQVPWVARYEKIPVPLHFAWQAQHLKHVMIKKCRAPMAKPAIVTCFRWKYYRYIFFTRGRWPFWIVTSCPVVQSEFWAQSGLALWHRDPARNFQASLGMCRFLLESLRLSGALGGSVGVFGVFGGFSCFLVIFVLRASRNQKGKGKKPYLCHYMAPGRSKKAIKQPSWVKHDI